MTARFWREYQKINEVTPVVPGTSVLWDGRFELRFSHKKRLIVSNMFVRPLGKNGWTWLLENANAPKKVRQLKKLAGPVRYTLPAVWRGEDLVEVPDLACFHAENLESIIQCARFENKAPSQILPFWVA